MGKSSFRFPQMLVASGLCLLLSGRVFVVIATTIPPTTIRPTTMPTTTRRIGCDHNGQFFPSGSVIEEDTLYNCYKAICEGTSIIYADHKCFLVPPTCPGRSEKVLGECCPKCHTTPTTTPTTTPIVPENGCLYNRTIHLNYDTFSFSDDGCTGLECHYGVVRPWKFQCQQVDNCNGTKTIPQGQCCEICVPPGGGCYIRGQAYKVDAVTKKEVCKTCICGTYGEEVCHGPQCAAIDCENPYRPTGQCCYTCGSWKILPSLLLITFLINLIRTVL